MEKHYQEVSGKRIPLKRLEKYTKEINQAFEKQEAMKELEEYSLEIGMLLKIVQVMSLRCQMIFLSYYIN